MSRLQEATRLSTSELGSGYMSANGHISMCLMSSKTNIGGIQTNWVLLIFRLKEMHFPET